MKKFLYKFNKNVTINSTADNEIIVSTLTCSIKIHKKYKGLIKCADLLLESGADEQTSETEFLKYNSEENLQIFYYYFQLFKKNCFFNHLILFENNIFVENAPYLSEYKLEFAEIDYSKKFILSKFALCRTEENKFILESPLAFSKIILHNPFCAAILNLLSNPSSIKNIQDKFPMITNDVLVLFFNMLISGNFIDEVNGENNIILEQWEFHDLLFHSRNRIGRHNNPTGATFRFLNKIEPRPAIKKEPVGQIIELFKPDIDKIIEKDFPFTLVIEERQSIRKFNETNPITIKQLGEFLYRTGRVKKIFDADINKARYYESSSRPYPGGGACYELEIYPLIKNCLDIERGLYYYQPQKHCLIKISEENNMTEKLIFGAKGSSDMECKPQILMLITARFQRLSWKYQSIAYSIVLKDAGVLLQTMYLTATAMELAPCAIGCGNSDVFAKAAGLDYYEETSVAEFMLGSK